MARLLHLASSGPGARYILPGTLHQGDLSQVIEGPTGQLPPGSHTFYLQDGGERDRRCVARSCRRRGKHRPRRPLPRVVIQEDLASLSGNRTGPLQWERTAVRGIP